MNSTIEMPRIRPYILAAFSSLYLFFACNSKEGDDRNLIDIPVTEVVSIDTALTTDYVAEITAIQNVEIRAKVGGYIEKIFVDEGKYVIEGQPLFKINEAGYREDLNRTKALYRIAAAEAKSIEIELLNATQLNRKNVISASELEIAKNKFASANAKVEEALANEEAAEHRLSLTTIRAPFSGYINRIPSKIGSLVNEGSLLTSISENREVFAYFDVSEKEYLAYAENLLKDSVGSKTVQLVLANGKLHEYKGRIETIEGEINPSTGTIAFRARFRNPDQILKHGASGKVRMTKRLINVLAIPQKATFEIQDKVYVYVVGPGNKLEMRNIQVANRLSHIYIVSSGLKEKDKIVYEGIQQLQDGQTIKPTMVSFGQILKNLNTQ